MRSIQQTNGSSRLQNMVRISLLVATALILIVAIGNAYFSWILLANNWRLRHSLLNFDHPDSSDNLTDNARPRRDDAYASNGTLLEPDGSSTDNTMTPTDPMVDLPTTTETTIPIDDVATTLSVTTDMFGDLVSSNDTSNSNSTNSDDPNGIGVDFNNQTTYNETLQNDPAYNDMEDLISSTANTTTFDETTTEETSGVSYDGTSTMASTSESADVAFGNSSSSDSSTDSWQTDTPDLSTIGQSITNDTDDAEATIETATGTEYPSEETNSTSPSSTNTGDIFGNYTGTSDQDTINQTIAYDGDRTSTESVILTSPYQWGNDSDITDSYHNNTEETNSTESATEANSWTTDYFITESDNATNNTTSANDNYDTTENPATAETEQQTSVVTVESVPITLTTMSEISEAFNTTSDTLSSNTTEYDNETESSSATTVSTVTEDASLTSQTNSEVISTSTSASVTVDTSTVQECKDDLANCSSMQDMCEKQPGKYMVVCRKSCGNCDGSKCMDSTIFGCSQYASASVNWCKRHSAHMDVYCPRSCGHCVLLTPPANDTMSANDTYDSATCADEQDQHCSQELCDQEPGLYYPKCKRTCSNCENNQCHDSISYNCDYYVSIGDCQKYQQRMMIYCPKSCGFCGQPTTSLPTTVPSTVTASTPPVQNQCQDSHPELCAKVTKHNCDVEPGHYLNRCRAKCDNCDGQCHDSTKFKCEFFKKNQCSTYKQLSRYCPLLCGTNCTVV